MTHSRPLVDLAAHHSGSIGNTGARDQELPVSEQFGPTLQGEGPFAGHAVSFLRTGGCNLSCSWCDTPYTWDGSRFDLREEIKPKTAQAICDDMLPGIPMVLSGGEPLLHQANPALEFVLKHARRVDTMVHVETNGTISPSKMMRDNVAVFGVSPKLPHAGDHRGAQRAFLHDDWLKLAHKRQAFLKVVVRNKDDVEKVALWALDIDWPRESVWVMPLGTTTTELLSKWDEISTTAAQFRINATQRLHVLAWGDCKGT